MVVAQRLVGHHRPEIGAADPDVDDRFDRLARMSRPPTGAKLLRECRHSIEHTGDLRDHVGSLDDQRPVPGHPRRDVQHRAALRDVILSRRNIAAMLSCKPHLSASASSSWTVSGVTRFFE
jgi:hypothetical protein